mmetsp:Transcript_7721/g.12790  ORF Transcript_7721/g.12790 Transcript_7721/m.12790 type:complete len:93 (+) Transcript_7721:159-437(+)
MLDLASDSLSFFVAWHLHFYSALKKESLDWSLPLDTSSSDDTTSVLRPGDAVVEVSAALDVSNRDHPGFVLSFVGGRGGHCHTTQRYSDQPN